MTARRCSVASAFAFAAAACADRTPPDAPPGVATTAATPQTSVVAAIPVASEGEATPGSSTDPAVDRCGALACRHFDTPEAAFARVLRSDPRVLAIGESHAPRGMESVESATARFSRLLLPKLKGRTRSLIVELMLPDPNCKTEAETVRKEQRVVTEAQSKESQNEFVAMGHLARALGIVPYPLRPNCDELAEITNAGDDMVVHMLETIATLSARAAKDLLARGEQMVVLYGGALHNDLEPPPEHLSWSFGPELSAATGGRYVSLDLIVPEFIRDTEVWRALPWYSHFDPGARPDETTLLELGPDSFVLVFPRGTSGSADGSGPAEGEHRDGKQQVAPRADQQ